MHTRMRATRSRAPWRRDWLIGMTSTAITDMCTFPLDTLKKKMQVPLARGQTSARDDLQ